MCTTSRRIFKQILSELKCGTRTVFNVHSAARLNVQSNLVLSNKALSGYFASEQRFADTQNVNQRLKRNILRGPLLCRKGNGLSERIFVNNPITVNSVRHYSKLPPEILHETVKYNSGIFQAISESAPVEWATEIFRLMHDHTGLPWWATIIITTLITRTFVNLPLTVLDHHTRAKRENLKGEMQEIAKRIKMEVQMEAATTEITPSRAALLYTLAVSREQKELFQRENVHPFKSVVIILLQLPVWLSFSVGMRNMCFMLPQINSATLKDYNELTHGGFGWIQNLIETDQFYILPVMIGVVSLSILEVQRVAFDTKPTKFSKIYTNFLRILFVSFVPLTAFVPSGLCLYWVTNNGCALAQALLLLSPKFRRLVRIPKTDSELQHPYSELYKRLIGKFYVKRSVA